MRIRVEGRAPLSGQYAPAGSANAAQALIAAALLFDSTVTLHNVPRTVSTESLLKQAVALGASVQRTGETGSVGETIQIAAGDLSRRVLAQPETDSTLGTLLLAAPLLIRRQHVRVEADFALNRIRTHLTLLRDLGFGVATSGGAVELECSPWAVKAVTLLQASVTATVLILMLAARLGKETTIHNAACEPHIATLCDLLVQSGARIEGVGSNSLRVFGTTGANHDAEITCPPDPVEAASIAAIAAISGGRVQMDGVRGDNFRLIARVYRSLGIEVDVEDEHLYVPRHEALALSDREEDTDLAVETAPWPGFPSDLVAIATVVATQARGTTLIHEKLYNNRLLFVDKLKAMGAQIVLCDPHRAIVMGATPLRGIYMDSPDVRTGLGMLAAALCAEGTSTIDNAQALETTYAGVLPKLQALGAHITVVEA